MNDSTPTAVRPNPAVQVRVVHEDADVIVVDKPAGTVTQPGKGHANDALLNGIFALREGFVGKLLHNLGVRRDYGLLHRLDKPTSGLLVVAKTPNAYDQLRRDFEERRVDKEYLAITSGIPTPAQGVIQARLKEVQVPNPENPRSSVKKVVISRQGQEAITVYRVVATAEPPVALVHLTIKTGRFHQIRAHMLFLDCQVLGDDLYIPTTSGPTPRSSRATPRQLPAPRLCLHAARLGFKHPSTGKWVHFETPLPPDLAAYAGKLGLAIPIENRKSKVNPPLSPAFAYTSCKPPRKVLMQIVSALSTLTSAPAVAQDIEGQVKAALRQSPDLLLLFISATLTDSFQPIVSMIRDAVAPRHLLAVVGESILGTDQEVERMPGVSALAISAPKAALKSFHLAEDQWQQLLGDEEFFARQVTAVDDGEQTRAFFMFGDPYTTPIVQLLDLCTRRFPRRAVLGGMASGMQSQGDTRLALNDEIHTTGLIGISFAGDIEIDCVVSQGCRPVGDAFTVTKGHQNVIEQLDGRPALAAIEEMVSTLPERDRQLMQAGGLQVGRVIDEGKGNLGRGDFLIRSLVGVRRDTGAVLIGDYVRVGQTLQFHVRDADTAHEEMQLLLQGETLLSHAGVEPVGALLVTCNGRGRRLFDTPNHDIALARQILGNIPIAGFFAAGELGPVGDKNFIHGHTAALALFRETDPEPEA